MLRFMFALDLAPLFGSSESHVQPADLYRIEHTPAADLDALDHDYPPELSAAPQPGDTSAAAWSRSQYWTREAALTVEWPERCRCLAYAARAAEAAGKLREREQLALCRVG